MQEYLSSIYEVYQLVLKYAQIHDRFGEFTQSFRNIVHQVIFRVYKLKETPE